eukprot:1117855-Alexandrium_andersonii.AAC.1
MSASLVGSEMCIRDSRGEDLRRLQFCCGGSRAHAGMVGTRGQAWPPVGPQWGAKCCTMTSVGRGPR